MSVCVCVLWVWVCVNVCGYRMWYLHDSHSVTTGANGNDCKVFEVPSDTCFHYGTQTSSWDKRAVRLSHCIDTVTGFQVKLIQCNVSRDEVNDLHLKKKFYLVDTQSTLQCCLSFTHTLKAAELLCLTADFKTGGWLLYPQKPPQLSPDSQCNFTCSVHLGQI